MLLASYKVRDDSWHTQALNHQKKDKDFLN